LQTNSSWSWKKKEFSFTKSFFRMRKLYWHVGLLRDSWIEKKRIERKKVGEETQTFLIQLQCLNFNYWSQIKRGREEKTFPLLNYHFRSTVNEKKRKNFLNDVLGIPTNKIRCLFFIQIWYGWTQKKNFFQRPLYVWRNSQRMWSNWMSKVSRFVRIKNS